MAFSYLVRSSLARVRARALISPALMDCRKSFRLNPSLLASSGSHHSIHDLSSTPDLYSLCPTLVRFFSARTLRERVYELVNNETMFGDGKGKKTGHEGGDYLYWLVVVAVLLYIDTVLPKSAYEDGVEKKNKGMFEEFKLNLLEPGFVSKIIVVDHSLALVYLKNNTEVGRVFFKPEQQIDKGVYLLGIKSPESFKEELEQTQKFLRHDPLNYVPVMDLTKNPMNQRQLSATTRATMKWNSPRGSSFP